MSNSIIINLIWKFAEKCGSQGISFIISVLLARMIEPSAYGSLALVSVILGLLGIFVSSGFGSALIQKKEADDLDYSSVFFFNIASGFFIYTCIFLLAPWLAIWYKDNNLVPIIRVVSLSMLFSAVNIVQYAYISKHLQFKKNFYVTIASNIVSGIVGVYLAYNGYGIWALVIQSLAGNTATTLVLWYVVDWRPKFMFSLHRLKGLFSYSWKMVVSAFLDTGYGSIGQLIVGKVYTPADLAFFNRGRALPDMIISNINASICSVLFPTLAAEQDNVIRVKAMTRRAVQVSSFVIWPMVMGLAGTSYQVVELLFTSKWIQCVPYMMCFCFALGFWPVHTANLNAIQAMGRSDIFLKLEIIKKSYGIIGMILGVMISPLAMALSSVFLAPVGGIVNAYPNRKLLGYTFREQVSDMVPTMLLACFMGAIVYTVQWLGFGLIVTLILQIITGVVIYVSGAYLLKFESFFYILNIIKNR